MQRVYMTKGLPGAGKTKWSLEMVLNNTGTIKRINKDSLRAMLDGGKYSDKNEKTILNVRDLVLTDLLMRGYSVIIDDTNLAPVHEERIKSVIDGLNECEGLNISFEIKDFTDVPLATCLERNAFRTGAERVPPDKIKWFYNKYLRKPVTTAPKIAGLPNCIIVDVDGTLAMRGDRDVFEFAKAGSDSLNIPVAKIVNTWHANATNPHKVFVFSGREDKYRSITEEWLAVNNVAYDELHMRPTGNNQADDIIKFELYRDTILGRYNVEFVLDDRNRVVDMWRRIGLPTFQVAEGDF